MIKTFFTAILFLTAVFFSCKKESDFIRNNRFNGMWELETSYTWGGPVYHPPGNGNIIVLGPNGKYERRENNIVVFTGTYSIKNLKDCSQQKKLFFSTSEYPGSTIPIEKQEDKLVLDAPGCAIDLGATTYRKL